MEKKVYGAHPRPQYDAIVVGSGIAGGWAAKELAERGLKTLLLERGRHVEHGRDYILEALKQWRPSLRKKDRQARFEEDYYIQQHCDAFDATTRHFFINDRQNPYSFDPDKPFWWIRGNHLGGRSLTWARQSYRFGDVDFEANAFDGHGVDWPIRYEDLAPWYDHVEAFIGVSGQAEGLAQVPDGVFLPPMAMNRVEEAFKAYVEAAFPDRTVTIGRVATLTRRHQGRASCRYSGRCARGCIGGAYFSSLSATLPAAAATGNLTVRVHSNVESVLYDEAQDKALGVRVIDSETLDPLEFYGRVIFLCASTLGTTHILLNSTTRRFPTGLGNSSGTLGHYLMDHHFQVGARGTMPDFEDVFHQVGRPNGIHIPRFRNLDARTRHPDFVRGYWFQGMAQRPGSKRHALVQRMAQVKRTLRGTQAGSWYMWLGGWGECLPRYENYVDLDPEAVDAWGIPLLRVHCTFGENERLMRLDMQQTAAEMLEAAGVKAVRTYDTKAPPGLCVHEMGTARMGRDPRTSVLNAFNQMHDVPNVFVTDGACMTSSGANSPSLTYMAITARACAFAVDAMKRGTL